MNTIKPLDLVMLLLLAAIWGASYIFIRIAAPAFGSAVLMDLRVSLAGVVMVIYVVVILRQRLDLRTRWKSYLVLGAINAAIPFTLIANAVTDLNASIAAILNSTTPIFTAIVAAIWLKDPLTKAKLVGAGFGMLGVAVLVGLGPIPLTPKMLWAAAQSLLAAFCYGLGNVYIRVGFRGIAAPQLNVGLQLGAAIVLLPIALLNAASARPTLPAVTAWIALALLCTAFAYILYLKLIANIGPTHTSTTTFLVPLFSVLWGGLFLNESIFRLSTFIGLILILISVALVTGISFTKKPALS